MEEPLQAHTPNELRYYLMVTACEACGHGPIVADAPNAACPVDPDVDADGEGPSREGAVRTHCKRCRAERTFRFRWEHDVPADGEDADCINPGEQPSRIVDLGQWVGLYHHFSDAADSASDPSEHRRIARLAWLCLGEALKFYGAEELPPESAFFTEGSAAAFREHRASYAHTHLRELQARLPTPVHHEEDDPPPPDEPRPWWKFWATR